MLGERVKQPAESLIVTPYLIKTPFWLKWLYPSYRWNMPQDGRRVYLTFDDGPHETATPFVLDELAKYNAKASFFCIGKNVDAHPRIYERILKEGHAIGNHTQTHRNGWKTRDADYLVDVKHAQERLDTPLFRPPYGRITRFQAAEVKKILGPSAQIIMWDVLSADFDEKISGEQCLENVLRHVRPGSIVVMHDSAKAWPRLSYAFPEMLKFFQSGGWVLDALPTDVEKNLSGEK